MNKYLYAFLLIATWVLAFFGIAQVLDLEFLRDPGYLIEGGGIAAALICVFLLSADILLPVPSSILMVAAGGLFGVFVGTLISIAGLMISSSIGFYMGRGGTKWVHKFVGEEDRLRAEALIERWGLLGLIVTRPIPVLSESLIILAGTTKISFRRAILGSFVGFLPGAVIYNITGAYSVTVGSNLLAFAIVFGMAALFYFFGMMSSKVLR